MAARFRTIKYTFASTDPVLLSTIINNVNEVYVNAITIRAAAANTGTVYWTDGSALPNNEGGYLIGQEAVSFDLTGKFVATTSVALKGSTNDIVYITIMG